MAIPLEGYESVAERIEKFWVKYPNGRIDVKIVFQDGTRYIVQTDIYKEITDPLPFATDFAEEIRSNANRFPLENGSTSAIGRSLHTGGLSKFSENQNRPSFEEMKRVERPVVTAPIILDQNNNVVFPKEAIPNGSYDPWDMTKAVAEIGGILTGKSCVHGVMIRKEGVGKTGKPYKGWVCPDNVRTCATWE
jgi:hypothetical protein